MKLSTRLTIAMAAVVLLTAAVFAVLAHRNVEAVVVPRALEHLALHTRLLVGEFDALVSDARADVVGFRTGAAPEGIIRAQLNGGIDPLDGTAEAVWRARLASRLHALVAAKPAYLQFRLIAIADGGREIVRIDRMPDDRVRIVPDDELQPKGDRIYFQQAVALLAGAVDVSQIELNQPSVAIGGPRVPVMRVATPLRSADGKRFGIVVVNLDMRGVLDRIRAGASLGGHIYVVNERGDYIVHPDRSREFGFEFGRTDQIERDYPGISAALGADLPQSRLIANVAGERVGLALVPIGLASDRRITVIQTAPYTAILAPATAVFQAIWWAALAACVVAIALAVLLARSFARPITQMTQAVEAFERGEPMPAPVAAGGEIGVLARAFDHMATDVRDKAVALARENAERRRLFDTSLDLILVVDRQGNFLQVSPSSVAILGYEPGEMIGRNAKDFIHPVDLDSTRTKMRLARRSGMIRDFETRYLCKDGRVVTLSWTGVWSETEQQHFFFGRDMTEQKFVQDALKLALARQEAVFNSSLIGILTLDESGSVTMVNAVAAQMFGVAAEAVLRRDIGHQIDLGGPKATTSANQLRQIIANEEGARELTGHRNDGSTFPVEFEVTEMPIGDRRMFVVLVRDITERKRNERMKDEFVATVSHELRTPLTSIAGSLGLLAAGAVGGLPDQARRLLTIAHTNSQRLVRLINDILDVERIESGKTVFHLQPVELRALVAEAIEANRGFAESFGVSVRLDAEAAEGVVRVDPDRMTQVITNLLSNAVKFSPRGEEVVVSAERNGTNMRVTVRDNGPGIPQEYVTRIFDKFVQVDASDARQKGGTGLGLAIVKQIMFRFGGDVGVATPPGGGSIFHVELPCWDHIEFLDTGRLGRAGSALILLCEDDPDTAAVLAGRLRAAGFSTDVAYTADEAVKGAATRSYAVILVDLQLPDSDGISLIKQLRAQPQYHNTPIVVVSADPKRGRDDQRSSTLNVLDWLAKPVDTARLLKVLNRPIVRDTYVRPRILHVDTDRNVLREVAQALGSTAEVLSVESIDEARHLLDAHQFDLAVLDVALAEGFGLDLLPHLCGKDGEPIPVVVFSAQDTPEVAARVQAVLTKSRASVDGLVATLRRLVAGRVAPTKEVA